MQKTNSDVKKRQETEDKSKKRQATERKENEVENEKRGWKKNKGRDNPRILSATYCSKRTKDAKNSGNVASDSGTLTIKRKEGEGKGEMYIGEQKNNSNMKYKEKKNESK